MKKYIRRIRNADKRAYAQAYLDWLRNGERGHPPEHGPIGHMAAQVVRLRLRAMHDNDMFGDEFGAD